MASSTWSPISVSLFCRMALQMASLMRFSRSAPHQASERLATWSMISLVIQQLLHLVVTSLLKMPLRSSRLGRSMWILRSNLPALRMAQSTRSMRLVAATITIRSVGEKPSIQLKNWLIVVVVSCESLRWLSLLPRASIQSTKIMHPCGQARADANSSLTRFAPTPTNISWNSEATTFMKSQPASLAKARAIMVLPVPGGPWNITPLLILAPILSYLSGCRRKSIISLNLVLILSPPQKSQNFWLFFTILGSMLVFDISGFWIQLIMALREIIEKTAETPILTNYLLMMASQMENDTPLSLICQISTSSACIFFRWGIGQ